MNDIRECWVLTGARCNVPKSLGCVEVDCPVLMCAARGDYGLNLKFQARYGRMRYIAHDAQGEKEMEGNRNLGGSDNIPAGGMGATRPASADKEVLGVQDDNTGRETRLLREVPGRDAEHREFNQTGEG